MAYIGKSPTGTGVRQRYYFTATGSETSLSGADDNSNTLVFSDGNYVDVSLNGIALVAGTDYNTSTANTIGGLSALSASDIVEIVVYDIFTVADTVSAKDGGTFSGNVAMGGTLSVTGASTLTGDLTVDTDTLYVDSANNRVGIGTSSPSQKLVTKASSTNLEILNTVQNSNGGAGIAAIGFNVSDASTEGDFTQAGIGFVRGVANGGGALAFYNKSDGATGNFTTANERMRIDASGNVLVGKTSTSRTGVQQIFANSANSYTSLATESSTSSGIRQVRFYNPNGEVGYISTSGTSTAYSTSSDYRLKENVVADWDATTRLKQLNPVRFNFIADADTTVDGFLAHEVQSVVPEAISGTKDAVDDDGNPVYQGIDQSKLVPLLVKTIQELEARITALETA